MDNKALIDYIKTCYELEKSIYLQERVVNLYKKKQIYFSNYKGRFQMLYNKRTSIPFEYDIFRNNPNYKQGLYTSCAPIIGNWDTERPHSPDEVILYINATRNMKFGFFESDRGKAKKKLDAYNVALEDANSEIIDYNNNIKRDSLDKEKLVKIELENEIQRLEKTKQILKGFYDKDIVFIKYRSLVSMSAILEYLLSGRCTTLPDAYNKYEEELRQAIIIDKLDVIIDKLDRIEKSQYMLYDAIMMVNQKLSNISAGVDTALSTMSKIQNNTAVSAHNSKIIADNEMYQSKLLSFDVSYRILKEL